MGIDIERGSKFLRDLQTGITRELQKIDGKTIFEVDKWDCDAGSGGRTELILMPLPPTVNWRYNYQPTADSAKAELTDYYLQPRDWLAQG